jgi:hypothetical protein
MLVVNILFNKIYKGKIKSNILIDRIDVDCFLKDKLPNNSKL